MDKQCKICGSLKAPTDFYANDKTCKVCRCAKVRANRAAKIDHYREYERKRGYHGNGLNDARKKYPNQYKAQTAVNNAIRDGRLQAKSCQVCGCEITHAHHDDYSKPLDVRWLCPRHHNEWHAENGEGLNR